MIMVPAWVQDESNDGFWAVLGSEPRDDAKPIWLPRMSVRKCTYAPMKQNQRQFALLLLSETDLTTEVKTILNLE